MPAEPLYSWILPPVPTLTMTVFGMFCPAWKFRFDVVVRVIPAGQTVMYPALRGATAVTFNSTADTPVLGMPPRPVTCTVTVPPAATAPGICCLLRESAIRAGVTDTTAPATDGADSTN